MSYTAGHGGLSTRSASSIVAKEATGFHLLRIDGYSQTKTLLPGQKVSSQQFVVGGHSWLIDYYPNGRDVSASSNAISLYLQLTHHAQRLPQAQARYKFSLLDHAGNAAYELPAETGSFTSVVRQVGPNYQYGHNGAMGTYCFPESGGVEPRTGCGHEEFIGTEELERRREHLIRDDGIVVRCDISVRHIDASWLAHEDTLGLEDEEDFEEEGYQSPGYRHGYRAPRRGRPRRRADDGEYVKWCLAQRPGMGRGY